jgi:CubicO group peptidase (beta-lactamase class C family)
MSSMINRRLRLLLCHTVAVGWAVVPVRHGVAQTVAVADSGAMPQVYRRAAELPRLRSMLVQVRGRLVGERYFHGATRTRRANIKSASKSIISALVGIAIDAKMVRGVDQPIGELLPREVAATNDPRKARITVGNLVSMRAGLQSTSFDNYGGWVTSGNWVRDALRRPFVTDPGGPMVYSTGSSHLLSAILTRASGMSTYELARRRLAAPLGITLAGWTRDPQGIYFGGNDMFLTPLDMMKVGELYLRRGAYRGRQIVPQWWVDSSFVPRTVSPWNGHRYGYGWWSRPSGEHVVYFAWGYGGQFIFIAPALELVVVTTSDAESQRTGGHNDAIHALVDELIAAPPTARP